MNTYRNLNQLNPNIIWLRHTVYRDGFRQARFGRDSIEAGSSLELAVAQSTMGSVGGCKEKS